MELSKRTLELAALAVEGLSAGDPDAQAENDAVLAEIQAALRQHSPRIVQLTYTSPIEVVVDLEAGHVQRVVVLDELVTFTGDVHDRDVNPLVDESTRDKAIEIAAEAEWPAWEFGW